MVTWRTNQTCALTCPIHVTNPTDMPSPGPSLRIPGDRQHVKKNKNKPSPGTPVTRDRLLTTHLAILPLIKREPGGYLVHRYKFNPPSSSKFIVSDRRNKNKDLTSLSHKLHPQFGYKNSWSEHQQHEYPYPSSIHTQCHNSWYC